MFDAAFTGAVFSNAHMPSGRRTTHAGPEQEEIIVPASIANAKGKVLEEYLRASGENLRAYQTLRSRGVEKQVASKILQDGIVGGGLIMMPVETLTDFIRFQMKEPLPQECKETIKQMEKTVRENGAVTILESRKLAPRNPYPNPTIFHDRENEAWEYADKLGQMEMPHVISVSFPDSRVLEKRVKAYLELRNKVTRSEESFVEGYDNLCAEARALEGDFPSVSISIVKNVPKRVWGEDKRHRTVEQTVESIYHARRKAFAVAKMIREGRNFDRRDLENVLSLPKDITSVRENMDLWVDRFVDSARTNQYLVENGIPESDAIYVAPRGQKVVVVEKLNLYNMCPDGFIPLRECSSAEPEMRAMTFQVARAIKGRLPEYMAPMLNPKCFHKGHCSEDKYGKSCEAVNTFVPWYNLDAHRRINTARHDKIMAAIEGKKE